jgi:rSAM/selenodomain-associated transferase 1
MAKAPRPGAVKTRLVPPLTGDEAVALSAAFLRDITANIGCAGARAPIAGYLAYAPAGTEDRFAGALAPATGLVLADGAVGDMPPGVTGIGRSLLHATRSLLALGATAVCLVNADSPTLPTSILVQAAEILLQPGDRMVLGPADDGGYYLIGLKAPHAHLFADIAWSTPDVATATVARAAGLGLEVTMLPGWYDVDDAASLFHLRRQMAAGSAASSGHLLPFPAPATAAFLSQLDLTGRSGLGAAMPA